MDTQGGGWAYVGRGSDPTSGCTSSAFGTIQTDPDVNARWSFGDAVINQLGTTASCHGSPSKWMEYYYAMGTNNAYGFPSYFDFRVFRSRGSYTMASPMDGTKADVYVWNSTSWASVTYSCYSTDCGGCNEPGSQNYCCLRGSDGAWNNCGLAPKNQEGQFSNTNKNQHLRCSDITSNDDLDGTSHLVLFVRADNC